MNSLSHAWWVAFGTAVVLSACSGEVAMELPLSDAGHGGSLDAGWVDGVDGSVVRDAGPSDPPHDAATPDVGLERDAGSSPPMCLEETVACGDSSECCEGLTCGQTTLGQVCCGLSGAPCASANGEECCGALHCIGGRCAQPVVCAGPCTAPVALNIEHERLNAIGGTFLGICGDANHTFGYHVAAASLPASDASLRGAANTPVCRWDAAAIDIGMDWPASREWLMWFIEQVRSDAIQGIAEVIGSYDGVYVRYWSDSSGWSYDGVAYQGSGHDSHTHVSIYRSSTQVDHGILRGWTGTSGP